MSCRRSGRLRHPPRRAPYALIAALQAVSLASPAQPPADGAPLWCNDCGVLAALESTIGRCPPVPDVLVDLERTTACEDVDASRLGSGRAATCSVQAAVDFVNERGDPSPGDGDIFIAVTARDPAPDRVDCDTTCSGDAVGVSEARPAGGTARQRVAIENRNAERLVLAGCGITLTGGGEGDPVVAVTGGIGPVDVIGIGIDGSAAAGYRIQDSRNVVRLGLARVRGTTSGVVIAGARAEVRIESLEIESSRGDAIVVDDAVGLALSEIDISNPGGHGIRAVGLSGPLRLERSRIAGVDTAGASGLELIGSGSTEVEVLIDSSTFSASGTERSFVLVVAEDDSRLDVAVDNESRFTGLSGVALQVDAAGRSRVRTQVRDSSFEDASPNGLNGVVVSASGGTHEVVISGNALRDVARPPANAGAISLTATSGRLLGAINGNRISHIAGQRGISIISQPAEGARVDEIEIEIEDNELDELAQREAIFIDLRSRTERAIVALRRNRIGASEKARGRVGGSEGAVRLRVRGPELENVLLSARANAIVSSSDQPALQIEVRREAHVSARAEGNRLDNMGGGPAFEARTHDTGSTLCLQLANNEADAGVALRGDAGNLWVQGLSDAQARHRRQLSIAGEVRAAAEPCWPR
jgi:hypothetical protein